MGNFGESIQDTLGGKTEDAKNAAREKGSAAKGKTKQAAQNAGDKADNATGGKASGQIDETQEWLNDEIDERAPR